MSIIGAIVVWEDGHEQVITVDEQNAVDTMVRGGALNVVHNGHLLTRDDTQVRQVRWLRTSEGR